MVVLMFFFKLAKMVRNSPIQINKLSVRGSNSDFACIMYNKLC